MEHRHHRPQQSRLPERRTAPLDDMLAIAEVVLGPRFDEDGKQLWWTVEDVISATGVAVTDGKENYFIYEKSNIIRPVQPHERSVRPEVGLKRVIFRPDGRKRSIATMAIRAAGEEFEPRNSFPDK